MRPVYQMFAVVNPNSKHKEAAVKYLEYFCQTGAVKDNPLLYANEEYPHVQDFMENKMVSNFESRIDEAEVYPILWDYFNDKITEKELIEKLTAKVKMQANE